MYLYVQYKKKVQSMNIWEFYILFGYEDGFAKTSATTLIYIIVWLILFPLSLLHASFFSSRRFTNIGKFFL